MNAPTNIQVLNGPDGKPAFVVIPYADYAKPKAPNDEAYIPHAVVEFMVIDHMTPVRAWREYLNLTQEEVAERLGVSQSAYSQQEANTKTRKATRGKIAAALGIHPAQLDV